MKLSTSLLLGVLLLGFITLSLAGVSDEPEPHHGNGTNPDEPDEDKNKTSTTMFLSLTFLIAVTVFFETLKVPHHGRRVLSNGRREKIP